VKKSTTSSIWCAVALAGLVVAVLLKSGAWTTFFALAYLVFRVDYKYQFVCEELAEIKERLPK
jgi:hypothetical protein